MRTISPLLLLAAAVLLPQCKTKPPEAEIVPIEAVRVSLTPVHVGEERGDIHPRGEVQYFELRPTRARDPGETIANGFRSYTEIVIPYSGIWEAANYRSRGRVGDCRNGYILRIEGLVPENASFQTLYDAYSQLDFYDCRVDETFGVDLAGYGEDWEWYLEHFPLEEWAWLKGPSEGDRRMGNLPFSALQGRWIYFWDQANIRVSNYFPAEDGGGALVLQLSFYRGDPAQNPKLLHPTSQDELQHFALRVRLDRIEAGEVQIPEEKGAESG